MNSNQQTPDFMVIRKKSRSGLKKVVAQQMKPAQIIIDEGPAENHSYFCVYVSEGKQIKAPCTKDVYRRIVGPAPRPKQPNKGLDMQTGLNFLIAYKGERIVGIDILPENKYEHGMVPDDLTDVDYVEAVVNQATGEIRVTVIPPRTQDTVLRQIIAGIDKLEQIHPHDQIAGKYEVISVSGNTLRISPFAGVAE